ncbi:N-acetylneuraminate lyase [Paenibacillus sp. XY044]|uniref:N-acetylneuraminate lyase n=1 Tax=Paenibacillus sp. XY044 TaxID=2026089 RepID=UPI000B98FECF|nr:N-acetylneuraminate lyase [Paenibacillus sp. XY044]OZB92279.1 N-acetylneuraminate lyase [Paenibacillus sp. XY044]
MDRNRFKGIFTALVTPMDEKLEVDHDSLTRLVEHQIACGIHGFYVGGSTGEGFILTSEERKKVLETVVQAAKGRAVVISHVGSISTMESMSLARHAEETGADAISAVVPFYYKVGVQEIREHYASIMSASGLPMIVYHYPGATGVQLSLDFYEDMARNPQCLGVKFTSMNLFEMQQIRSRCGDDFLIWNGHDEVLAGGLLLGADGAIGSTFNMMPDPFLRMYDVKAAGNWDAVRELQVKANAVIAHMLHYDVIPYEKRMLFLQGVISNPATRQPLKRFSAEQQAEIDRFYATSDLLMVDKGEKSL